jgi:CBS domain-containing protein
MDTILVNSIEAVARKRLVTISADASLADVAKLLSAAKISLVVVCHSDRAMAGVVTKSDIVRQIGDCPQSVCTTAAADVMTRNVTCCRPGDTLENVLTVMNKRGLEHIPVIDDKSIPSGVVDARDALKALMAQANYNQTLLRDYVMGVGYR